MASEKRQPVDQLDFNQVKEILPQRFPFLMIDRIVEIKAGEKVVGLKNISGNEEFFQGHFPDLPVMPGSLILEAIAQTAIVLFCYGNTDQDVSRRTFLFGSVKARFLSPAYPGDRMLVEVTPVKLISTGGVVKGVAKVEDRIVCKGELSFSVNKEKAT
ncbi:MAG: 3-hydroxyacyl-ACP dehydratase FabZ [Desulfobacterales bacterium]|nr:3-hydroxyacyl-ACP dehydratase FabZ [Desulfobacterales bacterium]